MTRTGRVVDHDGPDRPITGWLPPPAAARREPFWDRLADAVLELQRCRNCGGCFIGSAGCPTCGADEHDGFVASGRGTLYSWTETHVAFDPAFEADVPYVVGMVDLAEGCRVPARIVGVASDQLVADLPLELTFEDVDGQPLWVFGPAAVPSVTRGSPAGRDRRE